MVNIHRQQGFVLVSLIALLGTLFAELISFFVKKVGWRVLVYGLYVVGLTALVLGFFAAITALLSAAQSTLDPSVTVILQYFLPNNTPVVLASLFTMETLSLAYRMKSKFLEARTVGSNPN